MEIQDFRVLIEKNDNKSNKELISYLDKINAYGIYDIVFPHGENLLHFAGGANNVDMCEYLLATKKMHVNLYNTRGATPLYYAALKNAKDAVSILLKYNACPRIRSGFSGLFPYQATSDDEIKKMLILHDQEIVPIDYNNYLVKVGYNLYQSYKFRLYKYWLSFFSNEFGRRFGLRPLDEIKQTEKVKNIIDGGFDKLAEHVTQLHQEYITSLFEYNNDKINCCLSCGNKEKLLRCVKCKCVYFCNKSCQKHAHMFHTYDCK